MALFGNNGIGNGMASGSGKAQGKAPQGLRTGMAALIILACIADVRADELHVHGWEWAGAFNLIETTAETLYNFNLEPHDGDYAAATALLSVHSIDEASHEGIEGVEEAIEELWEAYEDDDTTATAYETGAAVVPDTLYLVTMSGDETLVSLSVPADGAYVIVFEHDPSEFEEDTHYLQDHEGSDVDPVATEPEANEECAGHMHDGVCHPEDDDDEEDCPAPGHWHDGECHTDMHDDDFSGAFLLELPAVISLVPMLTFVW